MPQSKRKTVRLAVEPLWVNCPYCEAAMRRDYVNRRTIYCPDRTISLTLQILRCNNTKCPRYRRSYRPEVEWHYALPGTKFSVDTCAIILDSYFDGKSNLASHRAITAFGIPCSRRSIANILLRYKRLRHRADRLQSTDRFKDQRGVFLDILVLSEPASFFSDARSHLHVVVRECFSGSLLAGRFVPTIGAEDEFLRLFRSMADRLHLPVVGVCCTDHPLLLRPASEVWPQVSVVSP